MRRWTDRSIVAVFAAVFLLTLAVSLLTGHAFAHDRVLGALEARGWIKCSGHAVVGETPGHVLTWPMPVPTDGNAWPAPSKSDEGECTLAGLAIYRSVFASAGDNQLVTHIMQIHSFGWPLPVLEQVVQGSSISPTVEWRTLWGRLIAVSLGAAVAAAALTALARWNIGRRRKLRDCCASCGYPLVQQGAAACPECGSDCPTLSSHPRVTPGPN